MNYTIKNFINQGTVSITFQSINQWNQIFSSYQLHNHQQLSELQDIISTEIPSEIEENEQEKEEEINNNNEILEEIQQQYHIRNIPQFKILFDNDSDSFDGPTIFSKIKGRKNIHFILKTSIVSSNQLKDSQSELKDYGKVTEMNESKQLPLISLPPAIHFFGFYHSKIPTKLHRNRMKCDCILFKFNKKVIDNERSPLILQSKEETINIDFNMDISDSTLLTIDNSLILRKDYSAVLPLIKQQFCVVNTNEDVHFNASTLTGDRSFHIERLIIIETYNHTLFQFK